MSAYFYFIETSQLSSCDGKLWWTMPSERSRVPASGTGSAIYAKGNDDVIGCSLSREPLRASLSAIFEASGTQTLVRPFPAVLGPSETLSDNFSLHSCSTLPCTQRMRAYKYR